MPQTKVLGGMVKAQRVLKEGKGLGLPVNMHGFPVIKSKSHRMKGQDNLY